MSRSLYEESLDNSCSRIELHLQMFVWLIKLLFRHCLTAFSLLYLDISKLYYMYCN